MRFRLYREHGALNSVPIFNAIEAGLKSCGHEIVHSHEDIPVIWSVLWNGRMKPNRLIYEKAIKENKPIMIIEVGNLFRNLTWRVSLNHVNNNGLFGNDEDLDLNRPKKLGIDLKPLQSKRKNSILIAGQHHYSLQWQGMPDLPTWTRQMVSKIREFSDRPIVVRPHPRCPYSVQMPGVGIETPSKLLNTYDEFNINYNYHCVINYNAGPAVRAAIEGVPVICDDSSLASEVSDKIENIEKIELRPREQWFIRLCHTEWTSNEIASGVPFQRLAKYFKNH